MNDAGNIGETPMRILDGSIFSISNVSELSASAIKAAQAVVHEDSSGGEVFMSDKTDEFLAHYGVLGMHWGRHLPSKGETSSTSKIKRSEIRKVNNQQILEARGRQLNRVSKLDTLAARTYAETTEKGRKAATEAYERYEKKILSHPDAETAAKLTSGEKASVAATLGLLGVAVGSYAVGLHLMSKV